jgi:hypothetical protein
MTDPQVARSAWPSNATGRPSAATAQTAPVPVKDPIAQLPPTQAFRARDFR